MMLPPRSGAVTAVAGLLLAAAACGIITLAAEAQSGNSKDKALDGCNGVFLEYAFGGREKEFPHVKNASAQAYSFASTATITNTMTTDLAAWNFFVGFQHGEILVSVTNAVLTDGSDLPSHVGGNGTTLSGYPQQDLSNSVDTAGDMTQIQVVMELTGTQFGVKSPGVPMPKTISLRNDGFKCPNPTKLGTSTMYVCCVRDPKHKLNKTTTATKFLARRAGDLAIAYDVLQAYGNNYMAQVTIDNNNPLGRLDNWNLTWEWKRGEFITSMRGAYTFEKDPNDCVYGEAGQYYQEFDFTTVANCQRKPVITDLPPEMAHDDKLGGLPFCCKNGTLLPPTMAAAGNLSHAMFQMTVFKLPPDLNRTALFPPQNWKISGVLNPDYKCSAPFRVSPQQFPDPSGLMSHTLAIASWQIICNITRPKARASRCCVSFSAFYNDSVVPCNTCACGGCDDNSATRCDPSATAMLLPPEALLVPFDNRTAKAKAWARIKHRHVPATLPCGDGCGVSINWHIFADFKKGWTARMTIFNWGDYTFKDWFAAVRLDHAAAAGYEKAYSFNGTRLNDTYKTVFFEGLPGINYLLPETDGRDPESDPRVPGKQQSVISFSKKGTPGINVLRGDGFPSRIFFNGEECALPDEIPRGAAAARRLHGNLAAVVFFTAAAVLLALACS